MIKRKPSDAVKMVLTNDPALLVEGMGAIRAYNKDRDLSHFDIDLVKGIMNKTGEKVTIVTVLPLRNKAFALAERGAMAFAEIARTHVVDVINYDGVEVKISAETHEPELTEESLDNMDFETLGEIVGVACQLGAGKDGIERAFFSADISQQQIYRSLRLPANRARIENAKDTPSHTDSAPENAPEHSPGQSPSE